MTAPDGKIRIPLNEEASQAVGQIEEFLMAYNGEGIQHIALGCDDLISCWDALKARGIPFMTAPPASYYEMLDARLPDHDEPVDQLRTRGTPQSKFLCFLGGDFRIFTQPVGLALKKSPYTKIFELIV